MAASNERRDIVIVGENFQTFLGGLPRPLSDIQADIVA